MKTENEIIEMENMFKKEFSDSKTSEYFKKVYVKSENDLPKEEYFVITNQLTYRWFRVKDKVWWLEKIDWYLLPVEQIKESKNELPIARTIVGYKCKLCGAVGKFEDFPSFTSKDEDGLKDTDTYCMNKQCEGGNDDLEEIFEDELESQPEPKELSDEEIEKQFPTNLLIQRLEILLRKCDKCQSK